MMCIDSLFGCLVVWLCWCLLSLSLSLRYKPVNEHGGLAKKDVSPFIV
jgi:hypothetical protein